MPAFVPWIAVACVGLAIGSFLNVVIHRLPRGRSIVHPRSACPACGRTIVWHDNLPVLSWILLRGRCRHCRAAISPQYPLVEAATAALFVLVFARDGAGPEFVRDAVIGAALIALILIDARHQILPNAITLPGIVFGLATAPLRGVHPASPLRDAIAGAALGYAIPWGINAGYRAWQGMRGVARARREDGIGQGDFKLLAMIGACYGVRILLFTLFFGALAGAVFGLAMIRFRGYGWKSKLPYGVFLGGAAILAMFAGEPWVRWYLGLAGLGR